MSLLDLIASNPRCAEQHFGLWAADPYWLSETVRAVRDGVLRPEAFDDGERRARRDDLAYATDGEGIAVLFLRGMMVKGESSFGGASTVRLRRQLRRAGNDDGVRGILLVVDSPGGTVDGLADLGDEVAATAAKKPLDVYVDDKAASAAFWASSQARFITAGRTSEVGSIGTVAALLDTSRAAEMAGIEVVVFSTGPFKGAGHPGTEITEAHREYFQARVDAANEHFLEAVAAGRGRSIETVREWADGRSLPAQEARSVGMIDAVGNIDDAMVRLRAVVSGGDRRRRALQARTSEARRVEASR